MAGEERIPAGASEERLRRLEQRLDRASAAAQRLMTEAAASAATGREPPPAGWQPPESEDAGRRDDELDALIALLRSLRNRIPPDLQQRLVAALRELLEAIRAVLDWYLERLEHTRREPTEVQDIPIL